MAKFVQCIREENQCEYKEYIYAIKKVGFDGAFVEWCNRPREFSQEMQLSLCRDLGLEVPFVHLGYDGINNIWNAGSDGDKLTERFINDIRVCSSNDIKMVVMHLTSRNDAPPPNIIGISRLKNIINCAEQLGVNVAFENTKIPGYLEYAIENINSSNVGICYDSGHAHCHFGDVFNWELFKDKIFAVHLHDNYGDIDNHLLPFDGTIDWSVLAKNLAKANYSGQIILESSYNGKYLNMSITDFCQESLFRAQQFATMLEKEKNEITMDA